MKKTLAISAFLFFSFSAFSQSYVPDITTKLKNNAAYALYPFAGGLNTPQYYKIDLNGDGIKDLFLFDRTGNKVLTFINKGTAGVADYEYWPGYESIFPAMQNFCVLIDYNCDGIEDIVTSYDNGLKLYKAVYDGSSLSYMEDISKLQFTEAGFNFDVGVGIIDVPGIADINFDGDIDILTFNLAGGIVDYYENQQVEKGEDCGVWDLAHTNACWGNFFETGIHKTDILNYDCKGGAPAGKENGLHAGSTFMVFDQDADGDNDIVLGDLAFDNLSLLTNGGDSNYANIIAQDSAYPVYDFPYDADIFPAPFLLDVNNDGKKDMIVSPNNINLTENFKNVWYYKNTSADDTYQFTFQTDSFLVSDMVDVGEGAKPVFFDYNNDGLMDIVIGNYGYYAGSGNYQGTLTLFQNTGTATTPEFTLVTRDWAGISAFNIRALYPAFGDLDNDGDADMLLGDDQDGALLYFKNIASAGEDAEFVFDSVYTTIDAGESTTPQLVDVNGDGLLDLLIGERNGNLNYYENTGTAEIPAFTLINDFWGGVDVRVTGSLTGSSVPFLYKTTSGAWNLLCGCENGTIVQYTPTSDFTGTFTKITDAFSGIDEGGYSGLQVMDITGDGIPELLTGNERGGITLYRDITTVIQEPTAINSLLIYPNPATDQITLQMITPGISAYAVFDITGRKIMEGTMTHETIKIPVKDLPQGFYFVTLSDKSGKRIGGGKFIRQ